MIVYQTLHDPSAVVRQAQTGLLMLTHAVEEKCACHCIGIVVSLCATTAGYVVQGIQRIAQWEAHKGSISALQWMQQGAPPGKGFITSASSDKGLTMWSPTGVHVGDFGQAQQWDFDDNATWRSSVANPIVSLPSSQPGMQAAAVQHLEDAVQQADLLDAAMGSLLCEASRHSDVSSVYSSGDEMLPECFVEPDTDS